MQKIEKKTKCWPNNLRNHTVTFSNLIMLSYFATGEISTDLNKLERKERKKERKGRKRIYLPIVRYNKRI